VYVHQRIHYILEIILGKLDKYQSMHIKNNYNFNKEKVKFKLIIKKILKFKLKILSQV
jgi:hypothetical protein